MQYDLQVFQLKKFKKYNIFYIFTNYFKKNAGYYVENFIELSISLLKAIPPGDSAADAPAQSLRSRVSFGNNYHSDI